MLNGLPRMVLKDQDQRRSHELIGKNTFTKK